MNDSQALNKSVSRIHFFKQAFWLKIYLDHVLSQLTSITRDVQNFGEHSHYLRNIRGIVSIVSDHEQSPDDMLRSLQEQYDSFVQRYVPDVYALLSPLVGMDNRDPVLFHLVHHLQQQKVSLVVSNYDTYSRHLNALYEEESTDSYEGHDSARQRELINKLSHGLEVLRRIQVEIAVMNTYVAEISRWEKLVIDHDASFFVSMIAVMGDGREISENHRRLFADKGFVALLENDSAVLALRDIGSQTRNYDVQHDHVSHWLGMIEADTAHGVWEGKKHGGFLDFYHGIDHSISEVGSTTLTAQTLTSNKHIGEQPYKWKDILIDLLGKLEALKREGNNAVLSAGTSIREHITNRQQALASRMYSLMPQLAEICMHITGHSRFAAVRVRIQDILFEKQKHYFSRLKIARRKVRRRGSVIRTHRSYIDRKLQVFLTRMDTDSEISTHTSLIKESLSHVTHANRIFEHIGDPSLEKSRSLLMFAFDQARISENYKRQRELQEIILKKIATLGSADADALLSELVDLLKRYQEILDVAVHFEDDISLHESYSLSQLHDMYTKFIGEFHD